jgi:hypothetical protein
MLLVQRKALHNFGITIRNVKERLNVVCPRDLSSLLTVQLGVKSHGNWERTKYP